MVACQSCGNGITGNCIVSKLFETRAVCLLHFELARQELETSQSSWFKDLLALNRMADDWFAELWLMSSMLGLLLGTEAPVMMPDGVDLSSYI